MSINRSSLFKLSGLLCFVYLAVQNLYSEKIFNDASDPILKLNYVTITEGIPAVIDSGIEDSSYQWFKDGELLSWETNKSIKISFPLNGDEGNYFVRTTHKGINFKTSFNRNIKIFINGYEIKEDRLQIDPPYVLKLIPFIEGLPIRYTLDGSEPKATSDLYVSELEITNSIVLRAKIEIPETDSVNIKLKGE